MNARNILSDTTIHIEQTPGEIASGGTVTGVDLDDAQIGQLNIFTDVKVDILPPPESELPPPTPDFVGREAELAYFAAKLEHEHLAVVTGMAGVGKTALAAVLARRVAAPDRVFWHAFHEGQGVDVVFWKLAGFLARHGHDQLWRMIETARQQGSQPPPAEMLFDYVFPLLHGHGYLLCFDDVQHVADDPLIERFLDRMRSAVQAGGLVMLITSRSMPDFVTTTTFEPVAGLVLADARALLAVRGVTLSDDLSAALQASTEGNAQFLNLAINALERGRDPQRLINRLAASDDIERYLMKAVDAELDDVERRVMCAVAVLARPATRSAIEAVLGGERVKRLLLGLSAGHLLVVGEGDCGDEYGAHAIVRHYFYDHDAVSAAELRAMHLRAAEHYAEVEPDVLRAAVHFAWGGETRRTAELATSDVWAVINRGQARELEGLLVELPPRSLDQRLAAEVSLARGQVAWFLGDNAAARANYLQALAASDALGAGPERQMLHARACRGMGEILTHHYDSPQEAIPWLRQGLAAIEGVDTPIEADLRIQLGNALMGVGDFDAARAEIEAALDQLTPGPSQSRSKALASLGAIHYARGDIERGHHATDEGLAIAEARSDGFAMLPALINRSIMRHVTGDWTAALADGERALSIAQDLGAAMRQAHLEVTLGMMLVRMGDDDAARAHLDRGIALAREGQWPELEITGLASLADLDLRRGALAAAEATLANVEPLAHAREEHERLPEIYSLRSQIYLARGEVDAAEADVDRALDWARRREQANDEGVALRVAAEVMLARGDTDGANTSFAQSLKRLEPLDPYEAARTKLAWERAVAAGGGGARAVDLAGDALRVFRELGARRDEAEAKKLLGLLGAAP